MTDGVTTAFLICLIPALVLMLTIYYLNRYEARRPVLKPRKTQESRMGQYIGERSITVHSIINGLFSRPTKMAPTVIGLFEEFSDVSFWQGVINWVKMQTKARKVIIRAGQNLWPDIKFLINYAAAKLVGFQRGVYFFYDGRASPGRQAAILVSLIRDDPPELGVWIDWEHNFGGAWEGLRNVVAMMQEVERLLPGVEVGMYTGYYFMRENSNPIYNASQYAYLKTKPLWLPWYGGTPLIPAPWTAMRYHQNGTPAVGLEWGVQSKEIDMNRDMDPASGAGGDSDPDPTPIPEPGEPMVTTQYKFTVEETNERIGPGTNFALTGKVYLEGDIVNVITSPLDFTALSVWAQLDNDKWVALKYNGTTRAALMLTPVPVPDALRLVIESIETRFVVRDEMTGKRYGGTVTDAPQIEFMEL